MSATSGVKGVKYPALGDPVLFEGQPHRITQIWADKGKVEFTSDVKVSAGRGDAPAFRTIGNLADLRWSDRVGAWYLWGRLLSKGRGGVGVDDRLVVAEMRDRGLLPARKTRRPGQVPAGGEHVNLYCCMFRHQVNWQQEINNVRSGEGLTQKAKDCLAEYEKHYAKKLTEGYADPDADDSFEEPEAGSASLLSMLMVLAASASAHFLWVLNNVGGMVDFWYGRGLQASILGSGLTTPIDYLNNVMQVGLSTTVHVPNKDDIFLDDVGADDFIDGELTGTGYVRKTLASKTLTYDTVNDRTEWDAADVTWTGIDAGVAAQATYWDNTGATDAGRRAWLNVDSGGFPVTTNGGDLTIQHNAEGIAHGTV